MFPTKSKMFNVIGKCYLHFLNHQLQFLPMELLLIIAAKLKVISITILTLPHR